MNATLLSVVLAAFTLFPQGTEAATPANIAVNLFGPDRVTAGERIAFTLIASNAGPKEAANTIVTLHLSDFVRYIEEENPDFCELYQHTVSCDLGTLKAGEVRTLSLRVYAQTQFPSPHRSFCPRRIFNSASIAAKVQDPDPINNTSPSVFTDVDCLPALPLPPPRETRLALFLHAPVEVERGGNLTLSLTASNAGFVRALHVSTVLPKRAGLTFNAAKSSRFCQEINGNILCTNFNLGQGEAHTLLMTFAVPADFQEQRLSFRGTIYSPTENPHNIRIDSNSVDVSIVAPSPPPPPPSSPSIPSVPTLPSSPTPPPPPLYPAFGSEAQARREPSRRAPTDPLHPLPSVREPPRSSRPGTADLSLLKSGLAVVTPGNFVRYNLIVANAGPAPATEVHITDPTPRGLIFVPHLSNYRCDGIGTDVICRRFSVQPGQQKVFTVTFALLKEFSCDLIPLENIASVRSLEHDPDPFNNVAFFDSEAEGVCVSGPGDEGDRGDEEKEDKDDDEGKVGEVGKVGIESEEGTEGIEGKEEEEGLQTTNYKLQTGREVEGRGPETSWFIEKESYQAEAVPGGVVAYVVTVHNLSPYLVKNVTIREAIDPAKLEVLEAPGATLTNGCLCWVIQEFPAKSTVTLYLLGRVKEEVIAGDTIVNTVMLSHKSTITTVKSLSIPVVEGPKDSLPETGAPLLPLAAGTVAGSGILAKSRGLALLVLLRRRGSIQHKRSNHRRKFL